MGSPFLIRPLLKEGQSGLVTGFSASEAGWEHLNFQVRRLGRGESFSHDSGEHELALVLLGGRCSVQSNRGVWQDIGRRADVFSGMPYALYLPRQTQFELTALTHQVEIACCWVKSDQDHVPHLVTPEQSKIEIRGGHNATRQINSIIAPGFACHKLVCVEVYTPGGNWSSYPPHKHDQHRLAADGSLLEGDLEEIYFYKFAREGAFAMQRVYTGDRAVDQVLAPQDNDVVLVKEGYHPVCAAYGYDCYYLNFLAGSAQTLACTFDPCHAWTMETWTAKDPRLPMVSHCLEEKVSP